MRISRQHASLTFPASFQLVACTNPCPCGLGEPNCRCSEPQRARYRRRLSAPFLDRFDLRVRVTAPEPRDQPGESSADVAERVLAAVARQRARYADWPWAQNAYVPAGVVDRLLPLGPDADDVWRDLIEGRVLTGRGAARLRRVARTLADLDDARRDHAGAPRERRTAPERHMTGSRTSTRLDPVELAAAILACLPDMTPGRLRGLSIRWGGPIGALAAVQRGLATGVLCQYARAEDIPARVALARLWQQVVGNDRVLDTLTATRDTRVRRRSSRLSRSTTTSRTAPRCCWPKATRRRRSTGPRVAVVGTRAATPHGLADAHEIGVAFGRGRRHRGERARDRHRRRRARGALEGGGGVIGVVATGLDVVYPRRHAALFGAVRESGLLVSELGYGSQPRPGAFPVRNRIIAALADVVVVVEATIRGGRAHHRRPRVGVRPAGARDAGLAAQPGGRGHQRAHRRRRPPAARTVRRAAGDRAHARLAPGRCAPPPARGSDAARVLGACGGEPATFDQLASRTELGPDQVAVAVRELERGGWMERAQGLCWPKG